MKIGSWKTLSAAAVAAALALPGIAQEQGESAAGQTGAARSGNAGQNDEASGVGEGRSAPGGEGSGIREEEAVIEEEETVIQEGTVRERGTAREQRGTRTANFPPQGDDAQDRQGQRGQLSDAGLVRWIAAGNEAEIKVNEFAQQQAQNEQVKQFAQKMVDEHTKLGEKLQQAARGEGGQQGAAGRSGTAEERTARRFPPGGEAEGRAEAEDRAEGAAGSGRAEGRSQNRQAGGMRGAGGPFLALHEEIKQQCAQSTIEALREKEGAEFDHAFMHQQIVEHMGMLDTLKVAEKHASQDLKPALKEAQQHTQQHLEEAKQIVMQLDQQK